MEGISIVPNSFDNDILKLNAVIENNEIIVNPQEAQKKFIMEQDESEKKYREYIREKINNTNQNTKIDDQQIAILKDTINRLNQELARYQKKYPPVIDIPLSEIHLGISNDNWDVHYKYLEPLFNSYDNKINELINENNNNKSDKEKITTKNTNLLKENANLQGKINDIQRENAELKNSILEFKSDNDSYKIEISKLKTELSKLSQQTKQENPFNMFENSLQQTYNYEQWEETNAKLEVLEQENNLLIKQQKDKNREIEIMKTEVNKKNHEVQSLTKINNNNQKKIDTLIINLKTLNNKKIEIEKSLELCNENLSKSTNDNNMLHNDLCRAMNEIREYKKKLGEYKKSLEEITIRYQTHVKEATEISANEKKLIEQLKFSDDELLMQKENYSNALEEINNLRNQQVELLQLTKDMEKRINELEKKEIDLNKQIQCHIDIAEEAKLNCDRALLKEDHYIKEIQRLKNSLTESTNKFSEKGEKNLNLIITKHESEKQKLMKEISMLEVSNAEARNQVERAIREKRTMETRLERITKQIPEDQERINLIIEDLTTRLRNSEREKDEITLKYEKLNDKNLREQNKIEKDKECLQIQLDDVYRRVRRSERELEDSKEDHIKLLNKISDYEHQIKQVEQEKEKKEQEYISELQIINQKYDSKVKELSINLEHATESYSKVSQEYQQLLSEQRKMSDKWKMESQDISDHYEVIITDLRSQIKRAASKIEELTDQQSKVAILKNELISQVNEEKKEQIKLHHLLKTADERAESYEKKIKELLIKQNEIIQEKKQLQREYDRVNLEKERLVRENEFNKKNKHQELLKVHDLSTEFDDEDDDFDYNDDFSKLEAELEKVKSRSQYREYSILK
ncbi:hypothetical protein BCR36DRAFT_446305 [Piromyces finnis]|uniref:Uncharacterized protein n=1 Tax=Piromyces finnis TaxID=1754191 RepID=A0A1Y1VBV6_9FUNG|nr:hypothetical protein BCR36DRAFT_446305 [Piromyces finnis]|eukprot:ORX51380.1 hypothetical protein BCR36DRAFT_446305 [Piromyces finnis]